jgi:peptide-methionine (S)-S-oxide reductase
MKATFAAGCFWGVEATFRATPGVTVTRAGFTGGHTLDPTYREVCSHTTGHAEAVELEFDPSQISYPELLDVFWSMHNPTMPDHGRATGGSQYRSAVFVHDEVQRRQAEASRDAMQARFVAPITTQISPAPAFYEAEEYHQRHYEKHGLAASCHTVEATRT